PARPSPRTMPPRAADQTCLRCSEGAGHMNHRMPATACGLVFALTILAFAPLTSGCKKPEEPAWTPKPRPAKPEKDYNRPLPPGKLALRKILPEMSPDFSRGFYGRNGLEQSIRNSLGYLARPSSRKYFPYGDISHDRAAASLQAFLTLLNEARSPQDFDARIRERFDVYQSVGCDDAGTVLYTGYYTPIFEGRKTREGPFQFPLYKTPPDLVKDAEGQTIGRRRPDG